MAQAARHERAAPQLAWRRASLSETIGGTPPAGAQAHGALSGFGWLELPRHGRRPLRFFGRAMLRADNRAAAQVCGLAYWSDIQILELYGGGFVVAIRHLPPGSDQAGWQNAWPAQDEEAVLRLLRDHEANACWAPPADELALARATQAWHALVDAMTGRTCAL
jgi:hypothetical protein